MSAAPIEDEYGEEMTLDELAGICASAPMNAGALASVELLEPEALSTQAGRVDTLITLRRAAAFIAALQQKVMASLAGHAGESGYPGDKLWIREDIAAALSVSPAHAGSLLDTALTLVRQFPATLAALESGELSLRHAQELVDRTHDLDPVVAAQVEDAVLPQVAGRTVPQFRTALKRAIATLDTRREDELDTSEVAARRVVVRDEPHGMASMWAYGSAEDIQTVATVLQARADKDKLRNPDDRRSADQRRFDALVGLAQHALNGCGAAPDVTRWQGRRPSVQVSVALSTLLGLDEQPAELDDYGPITAATAISIAADPSASWRTLITDTQGHALDMGRKSYRPDQALRDFILAQSPTCRFPTSNANSRRAEIDHITPWNAGGRTDVANLQPLSSRPHHVKDETDWHAHREPDGTITWTSPTGHVYTDPPHQHPIDHTAEWIKKPPDEDPPF